MKWPSLLLIAMSLLLTTPASAQTRLSLTGGLNTASVNLDTDAHPAASIQPVTRMSVGLAATVPTSERFGIQLGATYSQKGGSLEAQADGATITSNVEFDYIDVTLLARMRFPLSGERATAHLLVGPSLGLQSACQLAMSGLPGAAQATNSSSCDEHGLVATDYDIGLAGGGGIAIGLTGQLRATLGVLYTYGLSNIDDTGSGNMLKNRALTMRAGIDFPIG